MKTLLFFIVLLTSPFCRAQVWQTISSGTTQKLNSVHFAEASIGYIGGNDSLLLKTTDAGKTWVRQAVDIPFQTSRDIIDVYFENEMKGYVLFSNHTGLYNTTDGGATWVLDSINNTNMCFKNCLYFNDFKNGFVGGSMCFQGETVTQRVNGTWATPNTVGSWDASMQITNFDFLDNQRGLASATSEYFFKTIDGGQTWDSVSSSLDTTGTSDVVFVNDTLAYATNPNTGIHGILISTDGGSTWATDHSSTTFFYPGFNCAAKDKRQTAHFGGFPSWGTRGLILSKKIKGSWWTSDVDHPINDMAQAYDSVMFAVGDSGLIVTNVDPQVLSVPGETKTTLKIYPNPSNGKFKIEGEIVGDVMVFSALGKAVLKAKKDSSVLELDLSAQSDGLYFVKMSTASGLVLQKIIKR